MSRCKLNGSWPPHRSAMHCNMIDIEHVAALRALAGAGTVERERLARSALARLALAGADAPPEHFPGLERIYVAASRERVRGERVGRSEVAAPAVSIYRLTAPVPERPEPVLRAR